MAEKWLNWNYTVTSNRIAALASDGGLLLYTRSSVDGLSVGHVRQPCKKTAEAIEMPFGRLTRVGPRNDVLDGVQIPHGPKSAVLRGRTRANVPA